MNGFIDHKANLFVVNDDYEHKKGIAGALHKQYLSDDYIWRTKA